MIRLLSTQYLLIVISEWSIFQTRWLLKQLYDLGLKMKKFRENFRNTIKSGFQTWTHLKDTSLSSPSFLLFSLSHLLPPLFLTFFAITHLQPLQPPCKHSIGLSSSSSTDRHPVFSANWAPTLPASLATTYLLGQAEVLLEALPSCRVQLFPSTVPTLSSSSPPDLTLTSSKNHSHHHLSP